jgi:hypothetical protein
LAVLTTLIIGYAALSHYSASSPDAQGLGAALSVAPVLLIGLILAWRWIVYTLRATLAWAAFYVLTSATILILFFVASLRVWSLFVNFGVFGLMILMGVADHAIRRRVLPRHPGGGILTVIQRALIG